MEWRWDRFTPEEVLSPDGQAMLRKNNLKLQGFALDNLTELRNYLGVPVSVNHGGLRYRGYRSQVENARIGGIANSQHCQGVAFDCNAYDLGLKDLFIQTILYTKEQIRLHKDSPNPALHKGVRGLGVYPVKNFCHNDFRSLPSLKEGYMVIWNGDRKNITMIADSRVLESSPEAIMILLQKELALPKDWRI